MPFEALSLRAKLKHHTKTCVQHQRTPHPLFLVGIPSKHTFITNDVQNAVRRETRRDGEQRCVIILGKAQRYGQLMHLGMTGRGARGRSSKYRAVSVLHSGTTKTERRLCSSRHSMIARFIIGILMIIVHHCLYAFLDGKALLDPAPEGSRISRVLRDQAFVASLGNFIANFVKVFFKVVLSIAFIQVFWLRLRTKALTLRQIDAISNCRNSIVSPTIHVAMSAALPVFVVAMFMTGLAAITIYTPSALTVSPSFSKSKECTATSIQSIMDASYNDIKWPAYRVLMSGSYLPPFNPCGSGIACQYNVTLVAPAFDCIDTSSTPIADLMATFETTLEGGLTRIWTGTMLYDAGSSGGLEATIIALDMERNISKTINCTAYSALYSVDVSHGTRSFANVTDVQLLSPLEGSPATSDSNFAYGYAWDAITLLNGSVSAGPSGFMSASNNSLLDSAGLFAVTPSGGHTLQDDLEVVLASYIQNVSISLLSGDIFLDATEDSILRDVNTTCIFTASTYVYARGRLLFTYGVALAAVCLCVVCGRLAVTLNKTEERLIFSRILASSLNEDLRKVRPLGMDIPLIAQMTPVGYIVPFSPGNSNSEVQHAEILKTDDGNEYLELPARKQGGADAMTDEDNHMQDSKANSTSQSHILPVCYMKNTLIVQPTKKTWSDCSPAASITTRHPKQSLAQKRR